MQCILVVYQNLGNTYYTVPLKATKSNPTEYFKTVQRLQYHPSDIQNVILAF